MKPIRLPPQTPDQLAELDELYHTTKDVRLRQRAQLVLLAAEKNLVAREISEIVRLDEQSVRRWLKRYMAEGIEGLQDLIASDEAKDITPRKTKHFSELDYNILYTNLTEGKLTDEKKISIDLSGPVLKQI